MLSVPDNFQQHWANGLADSSRHYNGSRSLEATRAPTHFKFEQGREKRFSRIFLRPKYVTFFAYFTGGLARSRREWARLGRATGVAVGGGPRAGVLRWDLKAGNF